LSEACPLDVSLELFAVKISGRVGTDLLNKRFDFKASKRQARTSAGDST
jgi:hypothetical protein